MSRLDTTPRLADPDGFFAALLQHTRDLDEDAARTFCARLILLLANQVGDDTVVAEAMQRAAEPRPRDPAPSPSDRP